MTTRQRELRGAVAALFTCRDREVLVEGRAGTGKTLGILMHLNRLAWDHPQSRHLICRATRTSMTESVLVTFEQSVLGDGHPALTGTAGRANRHAYDYPNGSCIVVGGLDNPERLYSTEWDCIYVAEATEIEEDAWEKLGRAMRHAAMPFQQRIADCNPSFPGHWLNVRADPADDALRTIRSRADYDRLQDYNRKDLAGRMRRLISVHMDNPAYWDMDRWDWTDAGRSYVMGELASLTGHRRCRLFEGRWKSAEGSVYPEFDESRHVIGPFAIPSDWPIYVGLDPGYDHPCAILWMAAAPNGCYYIIDELYRGGLSVQQHAADIHARNAGRTVLRYYADPQHAFSRTAQSPRSIAQQFADCGIRFAPWPRSTDAAAMVSAVRQRLVCDGLKVFATCTHTRREFESWSYRRTPDGRIPAGDDQFEDRDNHAMDVIKGLIAANPGAASKIKVIASPG